MFGAIGGPGNAVDREIIDSLAAWRHDSPQLTIWIVRLTKVGSVEVTLGLAALGAIALWVDRQRGRAALLFGAVLAERLTVDVIKLLFDRPRPAVDLHPVLTHSASYPSGHAANSLTSFVAFALLAAPQRYRPLALAFAVPLALLIALTRPYLGVHWPSDTLGGWLIAAMFLLFIRREARGGGLLSLEPQHQIVARHRLPADQG